MLSRRHLRIKVLQSLYAFLQSGNDRLDIGEKQMLQSIDKLHELFIYILSFLIALAEFAEKRIEENRNKFFPSQDDLNPNTRFIDNRVIRQLTENADLNREISRYKINWIPEEGIVRKTFNQIRESREYRDYLNSESDSYKSDHNFIIRILKKHVADNSSLENYFEDLNIYWAADYYTAVWLALKAVKEFNENSGAATDLPPVIKTDNEADNEDRQFLLNLFRKTILREDELEKIIDQRAKNWEIDRIALMDKLILEMAIIELLEFQSIPVKVTLNEYIEIAKSFSTVKSRVFINGMLDKIIEDFRKDKKIIKTGRGLMS